MIEIVEPCMEPNPHLRFAFLLQVCRRQVCEFPENMSFPFFPGGHCTALM